MRPAIAWLLRQVPVRFRQYGGVDDPFFAFGRFECIPFVAEQFDQRVRRTNRAIDHDMRNVDALRAEFGVQLRWLM